MSREGVSEGRQLRVKGKKREGGKRTEGDREEEEDVREGRVGSEYCGGS